MSILRSFNGRFVLLAALLALFATATYGFAAGNTVGASKAGQGKGAISGYTVSGIEYTFNSTNQITAVNFTLDGAANLARAQIVDGSGTALGGGWADCKTVTGVANGWTCSPLSAVPSADAADLQVFATGNNKPA